MTFLVMFFCLPSSLCPGWLQDRLCDVLWSDGARWLRSVLQSHGWAHQHRHHSLQQLWGDTRCQICPGCGGRSVGLESSARRHSYSQAVILPRSLAWWLCPTGLSASCSWTGATVTGRVPGWRQHTMYWACWSWWESGCQRFWGNTMFAMHCICGEKQFSVREILYFNILYYIQTSKEGEILIVMVIIFISLFIQCHLHVQSSKGFCPVWFKEFECLNLFLIYFRQK